MQKRPPIRLEPKFYLYQPNDDAVQLKCWLPLPQLRKSQILRLPNDSWEWGSLSAGLPGEPDLPLTWKLWLPEESMTMHKVILANGDEYHIRLPTNPPPLTLLANLQGLDFMEPVSPEWAVTRMLLHEHAHKTPVDDLILRLEAMRQSRQQLLSGIDDFIKSFNTCQNSQEHTQSLLSLNMSSFRWLQSRAGSNEGLSQLPEGTPQCLYSEAEKLWGPYRHTGHSYSGSTGLTLSSMPTDPRHVLFKVGAERLQTRLQREVGQLVKISAFIDKSRAAHLVHEFPHVVTLSSLRALAASALMSQHPQVTMLSAVERHTKWRGFKQWWEFWQLSNDLNCEQAISVWHENMTHPRQPKRHAKGQQVVVHPDLPVCLQHQRLTALAAA